MSIIKLIFFVLAIISLYKMITEENTGKALEHLFDTGMWLFLTFFIQPII